MAKLRVMVLCESRNEFVSKKGAVVKQRMLEVHDAEAHLGQRIAASFSYELTDDEKSTYPADCLNGQVIEIGVDRFDSYNGKLKIRGALPPLSSLASVPPVKKAA